MTKCNLVFLCVYVFTNTMMGLIIMGFTFLHYEAYPLVIVIVTSFVLQGVARCKCYKLSYYKFCVTRYLTFYPLQLLEV